MAFIDVMLIVFALLPVMSYSFGFTDVKCTPKHAGVVGQQSMLECVVTVKLNVEHLQIQEFKWTKGDETLLSFKKEIRAPFPRYRLADPSWSVTHMNVSLLITNTEIADEGIYKCYVKTNRGHGEGTISLQVKAKYNAPTIHSDPEKIAPNTNSVLICQTDGGYPKGTLQWFDELKGNVTRSAKMEEGRTVNGLYRLTSRLSLLSGSTYSKYTCAVYNALEVKEQEVTFDIPATAEEIRDPEKANSISKILAPMVTIGSLIVGLLLLLVFRRKVLSCHQRIDRNEETMEEAGELMEGRIHENAHGTSGGSIAA